MSDLIVLAFDSEDGALQLRDKLLSMQKFPTTLNEDNYV